MPEKKKQYRHLPAFILLMIAEGPNHGNAIYNLLMDKMNIEKLDSGAVYRVLKDLEKSGDLKSEWDTSVRGPAKKIYSLTKAGWKKLGQYEEDISCRIKILQKYVKIYKSLSR